MSDDQLHRGWLLYESRRYAEALALALEVHGRAPQSTSAIYLAALAALMTEDLPLAEEMAGKLLAGDPDSEEGHALLGYIASRRNDPVRAEQHLQKAIAANPTQAEHQARYALFLLGRDRIEDGITVAWRGLKLDPESVFVRKVLQRLYLANDELELAEKMGREALERDPNDADIHFATGQVLLATGSGQAARGSFRESLRLDPQLASGDGLLDMAHERVRHWAIFRPGLLFPVGVTELVLILVVTPLFWAGLAWLWAPLWWMFYLAVTLIALGYLYTAGFYLARRLVLRQLRRGRT